MYKKSSFRKKKLPSRLAGIGPYRDPNEHLTAVPVEYPLPATTVWGTKENPVSPFLPQIRQIIDEHHSAWKNLHIYGAFARQRYWQSGKSFVQGMILRIVSDAKGLWNTAENDRKVWRWSIWCLHRKALCSVLPMDAAGFIRYPDREFSGDEQVKMVSYSGTRKWVVYWLLRKRQDRLRIIF